ncbi:DUF1178 family protein [Hydrogenophaga sp.]|uniref:DUF1178 family protein n=1 Tax=Hydrogenophaga sp. TaxID=1904254 RepID=UPI002723EAE5|nr:DUF1178 family protein [Hydrogenophaga sp.]MDO8903014.1 DUF1178 family protein [Hydrogenophaga sp.]
MKVLDLQCSRQHSFEGWFASERDFGDQLADGLVTCPMCGDAQVHKMLSAPRLNLGAAREPEGSSPDPLQKQAVQARGAQTTLQTQMLMAMRHVLAHTEDVGERFADEARAMHQGEIDQRSIRGRASPEEALALIEEGIEVLPLPDLPPLKETLQ